MNPLQAKSVTVGLLREHKIWIQVFGVITIKIHNNMVNTDTFSLPENECNELNK